MPAPSRPCPRSRSVLCCAVRAVDSIAVDFKRGCGNPVSQPTVPPITVVFIVIFITIACHLEFWPKHHQLRELHPRIPDPARMSL